jgi:hypothetical protein
MIIKVQSYFEVESILSRDVHSLQVDLQNFIFNEIVGTKFMFIPPDGDTSHMVECRPLSVEEAFDYLRSRK